MKRKKDEWVLKPIEPEVDRETEERSLINGMAYALVAITGISMAVAIKIARRKYLEAKEEAKRHNKEEQ